MRAEFIHHPGKVTSKEARLRDCSPTDISTHRPFSLVSQKSGKRAIGFTGFTPAPELLRRTEDHLSLRQQGHNILLQAIREYTASRRSTTPHLVNYVQSSLLHAERGAAAAETEVYGQLEAGVIVFETKRIVRATTLGAISLFPYADMTNGHKHTMWTEHTSDARYTGQLDTASGSLSQPNLLHPIVLCSYGIDGQVQEGHLVRSDIINETPPHRDGITMLITV